MDYDKFYHLQVMSLCPIKIVFISHLSIKNFPMRLPHNPPGKQTGPFYQRHSQVGCSAASEKRLNLPARMRDPKFLCHNLEYRYSSSRLLV